jgi:ribosomal protein L7Ae-like RNA K-turn-binding protein
MIIPVGVPCRMKQVPGARPVERLFPFVLRSRNLIVGRETLLRSKSKLHFVLITTDISENSRAEILSEFAHYPVVQYYQTEDLEKHFGIKGAKVVGFAKSGLAQSLYAELKEHRINKPPATDRATESTGD